MDTYFSKFPIIQYNNKLVRNITERVKMDTKTRRLPAAFYPYELKNEMRSDVVSYFYYNDSTLDWLVYLANGITDPYYDWYLYQTNFDNYIVEKYGSIENAQKRISHYATNWADDPYSLTVAGYNSLPETISKYYIPVFGTKNKIISYKRREIDWTVNTNKIIKLYTETIDGTFEVKEIIDIIDNSAQVVGGGEIAGVGTDYIIIQHVSGFYSDTYTIQGETSGATATIITNNILQTNIDDTERNFWSPVSFYDIEENKNESQKFIYLLDARFQMETTEEIRRQLQANQE